MKKRIIIEEESNPKNEKKSSSKIIQNKGFETILYIVGYAIILIFVSCLFKKSLYINNKNFGL